MTDSTVVWQKNLQSTTGNFSTMHTFEGDGDASRVFEVNFTGGYIKQSHVKAYMMPYGTADYEYLTLTFVNESSVRLSAAVPVGWTVTIYRDTPKDLPLASFTDGALITAASLDRNAEQAIFGVAEMVDRFTATQQGVDLSLNIANEAKADSEQAVSAAAAATAAASAALRAPAGEVVSPTPSAVERANKVMAFNSTGDPIAVLPQSGSASDVMVEYAKPTGASKVGTTSGTVQSNLDAVTVELGNVGADVADLQARPQLPTAYLEAINPQSTLQGLLDSINNGAREALLYGSIASTGTLLLPSYFHLAGSGLYAYRNDRNSFKSISKSGNATFVFDNDDVTPVTIDAIVGISPEWHDGRWPQQSTISNVAFVGDRSSYNTAGLYIRQGSRYSIRDCTFTACKNGIVLGDVWVSEFTNITAVDCAVQSRRGTSQRWSGCAITGHPDVIGAYNFNDTTYTTLTSCTSDNAPRSAYFFSAGSEVTMIGCGTEFPVNTTDTALGTMVALNGNCKVICHGFKGVPVANQTQPLISVGVGDSLHLVNWNSTQAQYPNSIDISINGDGSTITIEDSTFTGTATGNVRFPRVQFRGDYPNSKVIVKSRGQVFVYKCPAGGGFVTNPEAQNSTSPVTPVLLVNNQVNSSLTLTAATGRYVKTGNSVTYTWDVTVGSVSGLASGASIKLQMPSEALAGAAGVGDLIINGGTSFAPSGCYTDGVNAYTYLFNSNGAELTVANISTGTRLRGSITYLARYTAF